MGTLVFQATLGGQVNLTGPNTASTFTISVPAVTGTMITSGDTGTVTSTMISGPITTAKGGTGLTSFTANQVFYASSTSAFAQSTNLQYSGTDLTVYGITVGRGAGAVSTNTAVGASALAANTSGANNTAVGYQAGYSNTTGAYSTLIGMTAGYANTTGQLTGMGAQVLKSNTTGSSNAAFGVNTLFSNTTGSFNSSFGEGSLYSNTTASNNTAVGYQAAYNNTTGTSNTAVGYASAGALAGATGAIDNITAVGYAALAKVTGTSNTAVGRLASYNNSSGAYNTSVGDSALFNTTTASNNTAVGYQAGYSTSTVNGTTYLGYQAGYAATGGQNTSVGTQAGYSLTGTYNTLVGIGSGSAITSGGKNSVLGSYNGNQGGLDIRTASNYIVLSDGDGNPRIWYNGATDYVYAPAVYNQTAALSANVGVDSQGALYRATSSLKYKTEVSNATHGLADVLKLRSVTYKGKNKTVDGQTIFGGLIAEEVHEAGLTEFVQYAEDGTPDSLAYGNMVALAFKAIQEQQALIESLTTRLTALEQA